MEADWLIVGALIERTDRIDPALVVVPAGQVEVVDTWHTAGMRGTGSHDVVITDVFVPEHRLVAVADIYGGTAPGAREHAAATYRWPMVPALALTAAMPVLGAAERVVQLFADRLGERVLAYSAVAQKDQPAAQIRLGEARVRLDALRALVAQTADGPMPGWRPRARCTKAGRSSPTSWRRPARALISCPARCSAPSATWTSPRGMWCSTTTRAESWPGRWRLGRRSPRSQ